MSVLCSAVGTARIVQKILFSKSEGKRPLRSPRGGWKDLDIWKLVFRGVDWIHLAHDSDWWLDFVKTVMNLRVS